MVMAYRQRPSAAPPQSPASLGRIRSPGNSARHGRATGRCDGDDARYWAGRAALARELLALWPEGQAPADAG